MTRMKAYSDRRVRALASFAGGVAVIPSAKTILRNNDTEYPFRQNSDFYYLTGFNEPDAVLVLAPEQSEHRSILFLRERDRAQEIWNGHRLGVERAVEAFGVDAAFPIGELEQRLPQYLIGAETLHYALGMSESRDRVMQEVMNAARALTRRSGKSPHTIADPGIVVHEMRSFKSPEEVETLRRAAAITRLGHVAAMRATRPGLHEYEIEALLEYEYRRGGAQDVAYESIVAGGDNATILHYNTNRNVLAPGTLLLVDSGCELDLYASDVTRTWPVSGRFSPEQRAIYDIVLAAHQAACDRVRPGEPRSAFHDAAISTITEGLIDLGLLKGSQDENIEQGHFRSFYMHGTGHWLGLDVHDVGRYRDAFDDPVRLQPNMVTTVEPGIYIHRDLDCDERFKGIGVRIEDDLLVTPDGHENLNAAIPKKPEEIEQIVGTSARETVHA